MKRSFTVTLTIITVICILLGILIHTSPFSDRLPFMRNRDRGNGKVVRTDESFENVASLSIDLDIMNVRFNRCDGNAVKLSFDGAENLSPIARMDNSTLVIRQKKQKVHGIKEADSELILSLPDGLVLNNVDLDIDLGNLDLGNISADNLSADLDMGNVEGSGVLAKDLDIDTDMGNVILKDTEFGNADMGSDMGNVEVYSKKNLDNYSFSFSTDLGNIVINGDTVKKNYDKSGSEGSLDIGTDLGNIIVKY